MVTGAKKSGARVKRFIRTTSETKERYDERRPGAPRCISGRPLPGTVRGRKSDIAKFSKTERRPSRPFGGVLSAPVARAVFVERAHIIDTEDVKASDIYGVGRVCMKIAGRDAGKYCVIVNTENGKVLVDGQTRRRLVNPAHLEPVTHVVNIKADATHEQVVKALESIDIPVEAHVPQKERVKKAAKPAKK